MTPSWLSPRKGNARTSVQEQAKKRTDKGEFWWELRACAYYDSFNKPKIIYAHFQSEPLFSYDKVNYFTNNKCYISTTGDWFLLGLLNSTVMWMVFSSITTMMRGGFYEATTQNINRLPIPNATEAQKNTIGALAETCQTLTEQRYAIEQKIANRLISNLCPKDKTAKLTQKAQAWWTLDLTSLQTELKKSFELKASDKLIPLKEQDEWEDYLKENTNTINSLNQQIADKERALNQAVYELFGLTEEEIGMVER